MTVPAQIQDLETKYTKKWKQAPLEVRTNIGDLLHAIYQVAVSSHYTVVSRKGEDYLVVWILLVNT